LPYNQCKNHAAFFILIYNIFSDTYISSSQKNYIDSEKNINFCIQYYTFYKLFVIILARFASNGLKLTKKLGILDRSPIREAAFCAVQFRPPFEQSRFFETRLSKIDVVLPGSNLQILRCPAVKDARSTERLDEFMEHWPVSVLRARPFLCCRFCI